VHVGLTSEAVSWLSGMVGLIGCAALVSGVKALQPAGLAVLFLFNLLDCVDGDLARTLKTRNPYGAFLDSVCGGIIDLGFWAVVAILGFRHPELFRYPDGFGQGALFWLGVGGGTCFLAVTLGYLERTYVELLVEAWERLHPGRPGAGASGGAEAGPVLVARHLWRHRAGLETDVVRVASRHPAGVEAETRDGVRLRYARAGQFGSQRGAWAEECTRLVMALHREAPIDVLCCQQAVAPPSLLRFARQHRVPIVVIMEGHEGLALISELRQAWSHKNGLGLLPRRAAAFL